jgi:hypothetical protein
MDPAGLIPLPDTIPVHWGWFKLLLILTFVLHILLMNLMLGGSLLLLFRRRREGPPPEGRSLPILIALTINMGVPPLLFVQVLFGHFLYSSSVLMAIFWISVIPILIGAYYAAYGFVGTSSTPPRASRFWLGVSSLLLLFIGFMFSNNMTLMLRPERWGAYFQNPGGGLLNLSEPTLIPRYLHFVVASLAVAGLGRAVYHAIRSRRRGGDARGEITGGLRIFAFATMIQAVIGALFWLLLPGHIGGLFLGANLTATLILGLGIVAAVAAIITALRGALWTTTSLAVATIVLMILTRDLVRGAYLAEHFHPSQLQVASQAGPLVLFLLAFVVVGVVVVYMIRQAWTAGAEGGR